MNFFNGIFASSGAKSVIKLFFETFGPALTVVFGNTVKKWFARFLKGHNILILGPQGTGKTSLKLFLCDGRPFELTHDNAIKRPDPTVAAAIINDKIVIDKNTWIHLKRDLPGDNSLRHYWKGAIQALKPHGIIYLIDGRQASSHDQISAQIDTIINDVFDGCYNYNLDTLRVFYIFLNFSDMWGNNSAFRNYAARQVREIFEKKIEMQCWANNLITSVYATHMSPRENDWPDLERALNHFGVDL